MLLQRLLMKRMLTLTFKIYPYKQGSASAKKLSNALDGKVLKRVGSKYKPKKGDVVVNWGAGELPDYNPAFVLNQDVRVAGCKLATFKALEESGDVRIPDWWDNRDSITDEAYPVFCRTKLRGHSGDGIVIANSVDELVDAPLYTKYIKKKDEYRVHVLRDRAFFVQRKARKHDVENPNWKVRNIAGGFVFAEVPGPDGNRKNFECPADAINQAVAAVAALGLDFGGVDVIWNEKEKQAYVLEINTACGLEDRTADKYQEAVVDFVQNYGQAD